MPEISTSVSSRLHYRKMGAGPAIVLLHGFPESGTLWKNIWGELSETFTVIVPDFPGAGESALEQDTSILQMAECVNAILDNEGIPAAVIAGHSMGGYVAFAFAGMYPEKVIGLSLVHSTPVADNEEKKALRLKSIDLVRKGAKSTFISQMVPNLFSDTFKQSNPVAVKQQIEDAMKMDDESMVNFYNAMLGRKDSTYLLGTAPYPLQWVIGIDDNVIYFKKILEHCYKSDVNFVSLYSNCGHMSMIEAPRKLVNDLKIFTNFSNLHYSRP